LSEIADECCKIVFLFKNLLFFIGEKRVFVFGQEHPLHQIWSLQGGYKTVWSMVMLDFLVDESLLEHNFWFFPAGPRVLRNLKQLIGLIRQRLFCQLVSTLQNLKKVLLLNLQKGQHLDRI